MARDLGNRIKMAIAGLFLLAVLPFSSGGCVMNEYDLIGTSFRMMGQNGDAWGQRLSRKQGRALEILGSEIQGFGDRAYMDGSQRINSNPDIECKYWTIKEDPKTGNWLYRSCSDGNTTCETHYYPQGGIKSRQCW